MSRSEKAMDDIQDQLRRWAKKTGKDYPHQLELTLRNAVSHLDPSAISRASEQAISTLGGNQKTARRIRKNVERSLETAQKKLGGKPHRRSRAGVLFGGACLAACLAGVWAWMAVRKSKSVAAAKAKSSSTDPRQPGTPADPDLSNS